MGARAAAARGGRGRWWRSWFAEIKRRGRLAFASGQYLGHPLRGALGESPSPMASAKEERPCVAASLPGAAPRGCRLRRPHDGFSPRFHALGPAPSRKTGGAQGTPSKNRQGPATRNGAAQATHLASSRAGRPETGVRPRVSWRLLILQACVVPPAAGPFGVAWPSPSWGSPSPQSGQTPEPACLRGRKSCHSEGADRRALGQAWDRVFLISTRSQFPLLAIRMAQVVPSQPRPAVDQPQSGAGPRPHTGARLSS